MRKFRRKRRTQWVRVNPSHNSGGNIHGDLVPFSVLGPFTGPDPVARVLQATGIILGDGPLETTSLLEERKQYVIDRIVGRQHCELTRNQVEGSNSAPFPIMYKCGFIVLDVQEDGPGTPEYIPDPFNQADWGDTNWLWTETMVLGQNAAYGFTATGLTPPQAGFGFTFPVNNQWGAVDRTKIDVPVRRRVGRDQRLFFVQAMSPFAANEYSYSTLSETLISYLDVRVLINWTFPKSGRH